MAREARVRLRCVRKRSGMTHTIPAEAKGSLRSTCAFGETLGTPEPMRPAPSRTLDAALVAWILAWALLGWWVGREVHRLADVSASVRSVGGAVVDAGDAIQGLRDVPLVGGTVAEPGGPIAAAGRSAQAAADDARGAGNRLAVLLGLCVWLVPALPVLAVYGPPRLALSRKRRAV